MSKSEAYMIMRYADARETETHWHTPENYVEYTDKNNESISTDQIAVIQDLKTSMIYIHPIENNGNVVKDILLAEMTARELYTEDEFISKAIEKYYNQRFNFFDLIDPDETYFAFI